VRGNLIIGALVCALAIGATREARAQDEAAPIEVRLGVDGNVVNASFDVTAAFTEAFRKRLMHGLTSRVLIEMELIDSVRAPVAASVRACELKLEVWEDMFYVALSEEARAKKKKFILADEAIRMCAIVDKTPVAERTLLTRASGYRLVVRVALNPVSPEILEKTREFMSGARGTGGGGRSGSFLSAVANLFHSTSNSGGFVFESQPLSRPSKEVP
jgi:hypothetical protein